MVAVPLQSVSGSAAAAVGWIAHAGTVGLLWSSRLVDAAPWLVRQTPPPAAWVAVAWYAAWAGLLLASGRRLRLISAMAAAISGALCLLSPPMARAFHGPPRPPGWSRVVFFDVGQGDATLVWPAGASPFLVDAGGTTSRAFDVGRRVTVPAMWAFDVSRLGAFALTHGDPDHIGGAPAVLRAVRPRQVWEGVPVPRHEPLQRLRQLAADAGIPWISKRAGERMAIGAAVVTVLHPADPDWERQKVRNDDSIVLEIGIGGVAFVLPGDISRVVEPDVAARFAPAPIVILKAPHHGSAGSSSDAFLAALHPGAVVFSAGARNPFGHPAAATVERYQLAGAEMFSTAHDGAIVMDTDGTKVLVRTAGGRTVILPRGR
jgi:competence protein ComEC